jgi:hypothetical protein
MKKQLFFLGIMVFAVSANASEGRHRDGHEDGHGRKSGKPVRSGGEGHSGGGSYDPRVAALSASTARLGMVQGAEYGREAMESWREGAEYGREAIESMREGAEYRREVAESMRERAETEREMRAMAIIKHRTQELNHREEMLKKREAAAHKKEQEIVARERAKASARTSHPVMAATVSEDAAVRDAQAHYDSAMVGGAKGVAGRGHRSSQQLKAYLVLLHAQEAYIRNKIAHHLPIEKGTILGSKGKPLSMETLSKEIEDVNAHIRIMEGAKS